MNVLRKDKGDKRSFCLPLLSGTRSIFLAAFAQRAAALQFLPPRLLLTALLSLLRSGVGIQFFLLPSFLQLQLRSPISIPCPSSHSLSLSAFKRRSLKPITGRDLSTVVNEHGPRWPTGKVTVKVKIGKFSAGSNRKDWGLNVSCNLINGS